MYNVEEAFKKLKQFGITDNIEVVRRWLRSGKLKGIKPTKRCEGWRIAKEDLDAFIVEHVPAVKNVLNTTKVANKEKIISEEVNTTKVANELEISNRNQIIENLHEEIKQLREENRQQAQEIARLAAKNESLKSPKGVLKKRVLLLESIILERHDILSRMIKTSQQEEKGNDHLKDYLEGIEKQTQREWTFLESVINSMQIQKGEFVYLSDLEDRGINIWGKDELNG